MQEHETVPTYGLLIINHAYNEGQITFWQWLELSKAWAEAMQQRFVASEDLCKNPEPSPQ